MDSNGQGLTEGGLFKREMGWNGMNKRGTGNRIFCEGARELMSQLLEVVTEMVAFLFTEGAFVADKRRLDHHAVAL